MTTEKKVKKAIVPAAGHGSRQYPASSAIRKEFFPIVDRDGITRAAIQLIIEEALSAGVEEVCVVCAPGGEKDFLNYFRGLPDELRKKYENKPHILAEADTLQELGQRLVFREQSEQMGFGHAVWCAKDFAGDDPVLVLLGDHVYLSAHQRTCSQQLVNAWKKCQETVSSVRSISQEHLHLYGVVRTNGDGGPPWRVSEIFEKPEPDLARRLLQCSPHPDKPYLAFFGMHVVQGDVFEKLDYLIKNGIRERGEFQFTTAQSLLAEESNYWAVEIDGESYDLGIPGGYALTQAVLTSLGPYAREASEAVKELTSDLAAV